MTFEEFLDLDVSYKFVTLDNFYREHLYLVVLAECFYGDARSMFGHCIFTESGDFKMSHAPSEELFRMTESAILFKKDLDVVFFESDDALDLYEQLIDSSDSSHYHLSKNEIIDIIDDALLYQIERSEQIIRSYRSKIEMHQSAIDGLNAKRSKLKAAKGD